MADVTKHRDESLIVTFDFSDQLASGDTIATADAVRVHRTNSAQTDVSSEFGSPSGTVNSAATGVTATFGSAASAGAQSDRYYFLHAQVTTTNGEVLVAANPDGERVPILEVFQEAGD